MKRTQDMNVWKADHVAAIVLSSMAFGAKLLKINTIPYCVVDARCARQRGKVNALLFHVSAYFNSIEYECVTGAFINACSLSLS